MTDPRDGRYYWIRYKNSMHGRAPFIAEWLNERWWTTGDEESTCPCDVEVLAGPLEPPALQSNA